MQIEVVKEARRKCGYRKPGDTGVGIYLMGEGFSETCERFPFPLDVCIACGHSVKFTRGWTWINPVLIMGTYLKPVCDKEKNPKHNHALCPACNPIEHERSGLLWVGLSHYKTPEVFIQEAMERGVSKKLSQVPNGLVIGKTWVFLAHKRAYFEFDADAPFSPGIFSVFKPTHIDLVVDADDVEQLPAKAIKLKKKLGDDARLVKVE